MPWEMKKSAYDSTWLIMDAGRLRGVIAEVAPHFRVEIPWSGEGGGSIMFSAPTLDQVWCFVRGVESVLTRIELPGKPEVVTPI